MGTAIGLIPVGGDPGDRSFWSRGGLWTVLGAIGIVAAAIAGVPAAPFAALVFALGLAVSITMTLVGATMLATSGLRTVEQDEEVNRAMGRTAALAAPPGMAAWGIAVVAGADEDTAFRVAETAAAVEAGVNLVRGMARGAASGMRRVTEGAREASFTLTANRPGTIGWAQQHGLVPEGAEFAQIVRPLRTPEERNIGNLLMELEDLTRNEGREFAVVRLRGYRGLHLVRGGRSAIAFPTRGRMALRRIVLHTHPQGANQAPSAPDYAQLPGLGQRSAYVFAVGWRRILRYRSLSGATRGSYVNESYREVDRATDVLRQRFLELMINAFR